MLQKQGIHKPLLLEDQSLLASVIIQNKAPITTALVPNFAKINISSIHRAPHGPNLRYHVLTTFHIIEEKELVWNQDKAGRVPYF